MVYEMSTTELIDGYWYPHANYDEQLIEPEFIEKHISMRDHGFYRGNWPDLAASYGYCLTMAEYYAVSNSAEFATRAMVQVEIMGSRLLNPYEQKAFDLAYNEGYMKGQANVAKQLYELALMGEYKAIDKFLEVRGAFGIESEDTGPAIQISLAEDTIIEAEIAEENKIIQFPKKV